MNKEIEIVINGLPEKVPDTISIQSVLILYKEGDSDIIVEHNGRFVYRHKYATTFVSEGDKLELINPNFGG